MTSPFRPFAAALFIFASLSGSASAAGEKSNEAAAAQPPLTVCLDENLPPFSSRRTHGGFDVALVDTIGRELGRATKIRWFESELDGDKSPALEANALLADGLCDLVGEFPLTEDSLAPPHVVTSRLPDYDGAKPSDRRRRVALGTLIASQPVRSTAMSVVLGPAAPRGPITSLADLAGLRIGAESGTFGDVILMQFDNGRLVDSISHVVPGRGELFDKLERGEFDAALVDLGRYDAYRTRHPATKLSLSGFRHRIGFNMGFVALSMHKALVDDIDRIISTLQTSGKIAELAKMEGVTYLPPREPTIGAHIMLKDLQD